MGCGRSTQPPVVDASRKRLSVGATGSNADGAAALEEGEQDDRGFMAALDVKTVLELLKTRGEGSRSSSIASTMDAGKNFFADKATKLAGDKVAELYGLGYTCRKGLKPDYPNQDSWMTLLVEGKYALYGVFDGHGQKGHDLSNYVKDTLPKLIIRDERFEPGADGSTVGQVCKDAFNRVQSFVAMADKMRTMSAQLSGTTATLAVHDYALQRLCIAHVADSTAVIGRYSDDTRKKLVGSALTRDHKPNLPEERQRIERTGGVVKWDGYANYRVYTRTGLLPGLNMSRCIGDLIGHNDCGLSAEPEISMVDLTPLDHVLLVCSDGVWEFTTPQEAVDIVAEYQASSAEVAANALAKHAWERWLQEEQGQVVDDITVIVVYLQAQQQPVAGA